MLPSSSSSSSSSSSLLCYPALAAAVRAGRTPSPRHQMDSQVSPPTDASSGLKADPAKPSHRRRKEKVLSRRQSKQKSASKRQSPINSGMSSGKGRRLETAPSGQKKNKSISRRHSLAGAGTTWQAGVRRSTRIKSRPLQYWCGERFLYGRIHDSENRLPTVVGIKYASPGDAKLKVKSYVPDEYSVLLMPYNEH